MLRTTRMGRAMRGVVDNTQLVALTGTSPASVRRLSWVIGCVFASLSGVLIAPSINLDAGILTLLVVQTFGAAAIGLFTSLPLTYAGGLILGVLAALSTKYVGEITFVNLSGLPPSLPFVVLFGVLVFAKKGKLVDIAPDRRPAVRQRAALPRQTRIALGVAGVAVLAAIPQVVGSRLLLYTLMLATALIFLSLALLERLSGQLSLAQLTFAAVGGTTAAHAVDAGWPFLLALLAAALVAVPVGALLAIPAIRLSGLYLALATLGFALVMERMVFRTNLMFGEGDDSIVLPRPSFAEGDTAYYYLVLAIVVVVCLGVTALRQSRLGRLLRAMADSPTALTTHGMNTTVIKVIVFCLSAAIAGLAGGLAGPVTEQVTGSGYTTFASLLLVVVLALQGPLSDIPASFAAAAALIIIPSYLLDTPVNEYLPVVFGVAAVLVAVVDAGAGKRHGGARPGTSSMDPEDRLSRSPVRARLLEREEVLAS
jgi:ABC-type branched-subunit amino acid transport system permease subunit